jgi:hypothetical protein
MARRVAARGAGRRARVAAAARRRAVTTVDWGRGAALARPGGGAPRASRGCGPPRTLSMSPQRSVALGADACDRHRSAGPRPWRPTLLLPLAAGREPSVLGTEPA